MPLKIPFIFFSLSLFLFCNNSTDTKNLDNQNLNQNSLDTNKNAIRIPKQQLDNKGNDYYSKISPKTAIKILSVNKSIDTTSRFLELYKKKCNAWTLKKNDIANIFLSSKEIDGQELHHYYDVLPCHYFGKATIDGKLASYELNAGAFLVLFYKDTSIYLGYKKDDYKKYFLTGPGIE